MNERLYPLEVDTFEYQDLADFTVENSVHAIFWIRPDSTIIKANRKAADLLGLMPEELQNREMNEFQTEFDYQLFQERWQKLRRHPLAAFESEFITKDGRVIPVEIEDIVFRSNLGEILVRFARDISGRKFVRQLIESEKEMLNNVLRSIADGIITVDQKKKIMFINEAAEAILGWSLQEVRGKSAEAFFRVLVKNNGTEAGIDFNLDRAFKMNRSVNISNHTHLVNRANELIPVAAVVAPIKGKDGERLGSVITFRDVSGERKIQEEIRNLLFHDQLTKVYNRSYFEEILRTFDTPNQLPISIIVGDINGLKFVNDSFGNDAGDAFLQQIAQILKTTCREKDIIARWGGDSFIILLPQTSERTAKNICNRINTTVKNMKNNPLNLNIGLGTATKTGSDQPIYGVIKQAEDNMYHRKLLEQESSLNSIISSLEKTLAAKSHETEEHARRMRKMALFLGNLLQLSTRSLNELVLLSALHDLGKVAISEEILTKPGPLTEEEFEKIKEHPEVGYRIASSVPELASIAEAIRSHHEWWDGSGYPRGLKGEEIPLLARILAIADAYDVMTNGRPYKEAVGPKEALEEIKRCAGTQFDPHLVKILLAGLDEAATVIENDHSDREEV